MFRKEGLKIYLLNKYKASSLCSFFKDGAKLKKFKKVPSPQSLREEDDHIVTYHGSPR